MYMYVYISTYIHTAYIYVFQIIYVHIIYHFVASDTNCTYVYEHVRLCKLQREANKCAYL